MLTMEDRTAAAVRASHRRHSGKRAPAPLDDAGLEELLANAGAAVAHARAVRAEHRRRARTDRDEDLADAVRWILATSDPLKRERNRCPYDSYLERRYGRRLSAAARALQYERRQLRKMQGR